MKAVLNSYPPNTPTGLGTLCRSLLKALPFEGFAWFPHKLAPIYIPTLEPLPAWHASMPLPSRNWNGTWLVAIERPLPGDLFARAKAAGMRTALIVMHEWFNRDCAWLKDTDLFICPNVIAVNKVIKVIGKHGVPGQQIGSRWTKGGDAINMVQRLPLDLDSLPFRERMKVDRFVFSNGWGGVHDRKGWPEMCAALTMLPDNVLNRTFVNSQKLPLNWVHNGCAAVVPTKAFPSTREIYADADCAVVPSRFEGLGLAILEPMAMGLPVLATDAEPMSEYVKEAYGIGCVRELLHTIADEKVSIWGYEVASHRCDPNNLAASMIDLMTYPSKAVQYMSNAGRRWIEEQWGASAAKQLEELLQ